MLAESAGMLSIDIAEESVKYLCGRDSELEKVTKEKVDRAFMVAEKNLFYDPHSGAQYQFAHVTHSPLPTNACLCNPF